MLAAFAAGTVDAVAGGSGLIAVPALLAAGLPPHLALGTNKAQGVFGTFASTLRYARAGLVDRKRARITFPLGLAGSLCGTALVLLVPPSTLRPAVLALLVLAAFAVALRPRLWLADTRTSAADAQNSSADARTSAPDARTRTSAADAWTSAPDARTSAPDARNSIPPGTRAPALVAAIIALVLGAYDGFFGPGAGTFMIVAFALLFRMSLQRASADAKPINFASNLAALALFSARGAVLWKIALPMAAAQFAGAWFGAHLAVRGGDRLVRFVMLAVVLALVAKLAIDTFQIAR